MHNLSFFFLFCLTFKIATAHASDIFFSINQELQSFYLAPQNSSEYFGRTELLTKGELELFDNLKFKLETSLSDTFMKKKDQKSFLFNPSQLGLHYSPKNFEVFLGGFTLAGEGADLNNIFDVVNAQDYRQPFNSKAIGAPGIVLTIPSASFTVKAFFIPKNERSRLPDTQSPWWPRTDALPVRDAAGTFLAPDNMSYKIASESEENKPFENNFGASAKYSFSSFDLSLFYYSGANQLPKISPNFNFNVISIDPLIAVIQPPVELNLIWYRSEHLGGGATFLIQDWIVKGFYKQQRNLLPEVEKISAGTISVENSLAVSRFSLRYFLQINRAWRQASTVKEIETLSGFFEKSTAIGFYLDMNALGTLSGAAIYNEKDPSVLVSMGHEYKWTDRFKTKLSANILSTSGSNALAAAYDKTDNLSLTLNYDF